MVCSAAALTNAIVLPSSLMVLFISLIAGKAEPTSRSAGAITASSPTTLPFVAYPSWPTETLIIVPAWNVYRQTWSAPLVSASAPCVINGAAVSNTRYFPIRGGLHEAAVDEGAIANPRNTPKLLVGLAQGCDEPGFLGFGVVAVEIVGVGLRRLAPAVRKCREDAARRDEVHMRAGLPTQRQRLQRSHLRRVSCHRDLPRRLASDCVLRVP